MAQTGQISELLLRWEELRKQGQSLTAEELCRDCPEHLPEIQRQIAALRAVYQVVETANSDQPAMPPRQAQDPAAGAPPTATCNLSPLSGFASAATFPGGPVIPDYEILEELGRGGMGVVYKARQIKLNRLVALKMILAGDLAGEQELARFRIEAEAVARLRHPNIVQIHEIGETKWGPFISLEFVEGEGLDKKINGRPLPPGQAAPLMETLARAMDGAHQQGIIHRDLKPQNILLTLDGQPKITDFGLAKRLDKEQAQTQSGAVIGTPSYMAPEQAWGKRETAPIGPRADVYSLGAILYELLTGRPPFRGENALDTLEKLVAEEPVSPSRLQPKVPRDLETICLKCLRKEPQERYGSAHQLAEDLHRFQVGEPVQARPVGRLDQALRWVRRHPTKAIAVGLACLVMVLGCVGGMIVSLWQRAEAAQELARTAQAKAEASLISMTQANKKADKTLNQLVRIKNIRDVDLAYRDALEGNWSRAKSILRGCPENLRGWEWNYVLGLCARAPLNFDGHSDAVTSVSFSPNSGRLASGSSDGTVRLWNLANGKAAILPRNTSDVNCVSFSPDGRLLATGSRDKTLRLWDLTTAKERLVKGFVPLASGGLGSGGIFWDLTRAKEVHVLRGHTAEVRGGAFSPDGKYLASCSPDRTVRIWHVETGMPWLILAGHTDGVNGVAYSPEGRFLASAGADKTVRLWDMTTKKELAVLQGHTGSVWSVSFSPDSRRLGSGSSDGTVRVWDLAGREAVVLKGHTQRVMSVSISPEGGRLASGSADGTVRVWDLAGGRAAILKGHTSEVNSVSFSADGGWLVSGSVDTTVRVWDLARVEAAIFKGHTSQVNSVSFGPDNRRLASGSSAGTVRVWDLASGKADILQGHTGKVNSVSFSPSGRHLASASFDWTIRVWDLASGEADILKSHVGGGEVHSVSFNADGGRLASGSSDGMVRVFDLKSREAVFLTGHTGAVMSVGFSPDGRSLASGSADKTVRVWDLVTDVAGKLTAKMAILKAHSHGVRSVGFSPDGGRLASGLSDGTVRVWDLVSGETVTLQGHTGEINSVGFNANGRRLATGSSDGTVRVWDLASGEAVSLKTPAEGITGVTFSPDGRCLAGSSSDGTVRVWEAMDTRHFWHLREAAACEIQGHWFAAAFHLNRCMAKLLALEVVSGASSPPPLGAVASLVALRWSEGRADLGKLQERLRTVTAKLEEIRREREAKQGKPRP